METVGRVTLTLFTIGVTCVVVLATTMVGEGKDAWIQVGLGISVACDTAVAVTLACWINWGAMSS